MDEIEQGKKRLRSFHWVEEVHMYLQSLPPSEARKLVESHEEDELGHYVNFRTYQQAYICDYLAYLWELSPAAFWRHVRVSLIHPEGLVLSDRDEYLSIICDEPMPADVWEAVLDTLVYAEPWSLKTELGVFEIIRRQTADSSRAPEMRRLLARWVTALPTMDTHRFEGAFEECGYFDDQEGWPTLRPPAQVLNLLQECFGDTVPEWLRGAIQDARSKCRD